MHIRLHLGAKKSMTVSLKERVYYRSGYVCIYVCMHVCMYVCMYVFACALCTCIRTYIYT